MDLSWIWPTSNWTSGLFCCSSEASRRAPLGLPLAEPLGKCRADDEFFDCAETNEDLCRLRSARLRSDISVASTPSTRLPESEAGWSPSSRSYSLASLDEEVKAMALLERTRNSFREKNPSAGDGPEMEWANEDTARRLWSACEGNQCRADKAFLQAMEFRLRDRHLYASLQFEKRCDIRIIGYDKVAHPVVYFCALSQKDWLSLIKDQFLATFEAARRMSSNDGRIVCIVDMHGLQARLNADYTAVKDLADQMGCVFAERIERIILVDFSTAAQTIWWMLKPFLSEVTQRKFSFVSARKAKDLVLNELAEETAKKVIRSFEVNRSELSEQERERHNELTTVPFPS